MSFKLKLPFKIQILKSRAYTRDFITIQIENQKICEFWGARIF